MDGIEFSKIFGAFAGALLFFLLLGWAAESVFHTRPLEQPAYEIEAY